MKTLLSLFDYTGEWAKPFWDSGRWDVITVDLKNGEDIMDIRTAEDALETWGDVDGILIAVPCTDFTAAGAQYWPAKDADGRTKASLQLLAKSFAIVDLYRPTDPDFYDEGGTFFWALENPVGRLPKLVDLWPSTDYVGTGGWTDDPFVPWYFQPADFAGWLDPDPETIARLDAIRMKDGNGVTADEAAFILDWNAYTKKTGIWGDFRRPDPRPLDPVKACRQGSPLQRIGGSDGERGKAIRSMTPAGFAKAFFAANGGNA